MNYATDLVEYARHLRAWNMPEYFKPLIVRKSKNQHGTTYTFKDGSRAFVPKGYSAAKEIARKQVIV